jgi:hypothetical protein
MLWTTSRNQLDELYNYISQRTVHHVWDLLIVSTTSSTKISIDLSYPTLHHVCNDWLMMTSSSLMWPDNVRWFRRSACWTWLSMCPNAHYATLRNGIYDGKRKHKCPTSSISLLQFMTFVKWDIVHEDKPLSIKARNEFDMNEF